MRLGQVQACDIVFCETHCIPGKVSPNTDLPLPCKPGERRSSNGGIYECAYEGQCHYMCSSCPNSERYSRYSWRVVCQEDPFLKGECFDPSRWGWTPTPPTLVEKIQFKISEIPYAPYIIAGALTLLTFQVIVRPIVDKILGHRRTPWEI